MSETRISAAAFADTKPHYELLDGLRGVAALLVVFYHIFEGLSFAAGGTLITTINHGYLAVDFFFILSGFVIGYAYDDRLGKTMSLGNFFKRRLIRLHPMIVMGAVIGAVTFCIQGSVQWDGTKIATSMVMLALLCAMFFIPAVPGVRYEVFRACVMKYAATERCFRSTVPVGRYSSNTSEIYYTRYSFIGYPRRHWPYSSAYWASSWLGLPCSMSQATA